MKGSVTVKLGGFVFIFFFGGVVYDWGEKPLPQLQGTWPHSSSQFSFAVTFTQVASSHLQ